MALISEQQEPLNMPRATSFFAAVLAASSLSGGASANEDPMAGTYGNVVVVTNAKGDVSKLWISQDGTYSYESAKGERRSGRWTRKGDQLCLTPNPREGAPTPKESCSEFKGSHRVGDTWKQKNALGEEVTVEIRAPE